MFFFGKDDDLPRAVSAMLKERLNLKLAVTEGSKFGRKQPPLAGLVAKGTGIKNPAKSKGKKNVSVLIFLRTVHATTYLLCL